MIVVRTVLTVFAAAVLSAVPAAAQTAVDLGFLAGVSHSSMSGDTGLFFADEAFASFDEIAGELEGGRTGMAVGMFAAINTERSPSFRIELLIAEQGGVGEYEGSATLADLGVTELSGEVSMRTTYVEMPVCALFDLPGSRQMSWKLLAGVALCLPTSGDLEVDSYVGGVYYTDTYSFDDRLGGLLTRGLVGLEWDLVFGEVPFQLGVRYEFDFGRFDDGWGDAVLDGYKHRSVSALLGVPF